jgi:NADP-dependent alcohol dehydrogenase
MVKFEYRNPTHILFGEGQIAELKGLIAPGARVLLLYGGGSIKRNGIHNQVLAALNGCVVTEFGGIEGKILGLGDHR